MVSCTDFSEDIQNLDNKVNNLGNTTQTELASLQKAITDLEAKLSAQYATKDEVAALKTTLENSIASEVAALSEDIAEVSAALNTAKSEINAAIAGLDSKKADKADVDAAVETATKAIAALQADLEATKAEIEAEIEDVKAEIAATQEELAAQIKGVDAKANELQNTLLSLSDYLKTLEAKINEVNNTLLSLAEYLPTVEAKVAELKNTLDSLSDHLAEREPVVDAKLAELQATLISLSNHLEEYEAVTDFKLVELQGSLAALSTYLEEYEASVDAKFNEILNTFESLSLFLDDKFAALDATDTDLYKEIDGIRVVLTALNNLLADETAAREAEDGAIYELIGSSVTALNNLISDLQAEDEALYVELEGVREAFTTLNNLLNDEAATREAEDAALYELIGTSVTALNNLIADLEAEDEAIYAEIENVRTYVAQVYNALSYEIAATNAALQAHIAAYEAFKTEMYEAIKLLYINDDAISERLANHTDKLAKIIAAEVAELEAADAELWKKVNALEENLSQAINYLLAEMTDADQALYDKISEETEAMYRELQVNITNVNNLVTDLSEQFVALTERVAANETAIESIEDAIEQLTEWLKTNDANDAAISQVVNTLVDDLDKAIADIKALQEEDGAIYKFIGETATALNNLIADANRTIQGLKDLCSDQQNQIGANKDAIYALNVLLDQIQADFGARLEALENQVGANTEAIQKLVERVQSLVYVPEYADHKATIEYAVISLDEMENDRPAEAYANREDGKQLPYTYVAKASDLKYLVKADNAAEVAEAIAKNWASVLDYEVKDVKTTRAASETGADLEIVNVEAKGEYIIVSVVAKNFDAKFFEKKKIGGIYSAALVLADENNTRTTEYTNLVPGTPAEFQMGLFVENEEAEVAAEALRITENNEVIPYMMPCNDTELVKSAVKPIVGFVPVVDGQPVLTTPVRFYTPELLAEEGYDIDVDMAITIVDCEKVNEHDGTMDVKPDFVKIDPYFNIEAGNPVYDFHYTVKEGVSFDNVGKKSTVEYVFTCGNVVSSLTYEFELANAQIAIEAVKDIYWTVAKHLSLFEETHYGKDLVFELDEYTAVGGPVVSLKSALGQAKKSTTSYVMGENGWVASSKIISNKSFTETGAIYYLGGGKYSWNNSYKVVFVTTNEAQHVDYTTTIIVNLVGKPEAIEVPVEVDFTLSEDLGYFAADVDLFGESFAAMEEYLGYPTAQEDTIAWTTMFNSFVEAKEPVQVNGSLVGARHLNDLEQARLYISHHNAGDYTILTDEPNVISYTANTWYGVPVNFSVKGNVVLPEAELIYSQDYVKGNLDTDPYAVAEGEIADGKYSIIKSDLAKYFNVEAASLEKHNYIVTFEVSSPEGDLVTLSGNTTDVNDKGTSTYHYLTEDLVVLDWADYNGLEVIVNATLAVNGFELQSRKLAIRTQDPLELTATKLEVTRPHRQDLTVQVFKNLVLTSAVEPEKENLIAFVNANGQDKSKKYAFQYAVDTYGVEIDFVLGSNGVYYYDNSGKIVTVATNKYKYDSDKGMITIYGDDAVGKNYYADFTAVMTSRICGGEHRVPFQIVFKK